MLTKSGLIVALAPPNETLWPYVGYVTDPFGRGGMVVCTWNREGKLINDEESPMDLDLSSEPDVVLNTTTPDESFKRHVWEAWCRCDRDKEAWGRSCYAFI